MIDEKYIVRDENGDVVSVVSDRLIEQRNISDKSLECIKKLHLKRFQVKEQMSQTRDRSELRAFADMIKEVEYELQDLWGFERDYSMHDWFDVPKCTCPKIDNRDRKGTGYQIISLDCPVHGDTND
jgi:hypothetical protein